MKVGDIVQSKVNDAPLVRDGCYRVVEVKGPFVRVAACDRFPTVAAYYWWNVYVDRFTMAPVTLAMLC
jgi:hypothetical protein